MLQLVKGSDAGPTLRWSSKKTVSGSFFSCGLDGGRIWTSDASAPSSGPYEDEQDAQRRYDRIAREEEAREILEEEDSPTEAEAAYESGFDFLRNFVGVGGSKGSVASA